jgi:hypothetical protein
MLIYTLTILTPILLLHYYYPSYLLPYYPHCSTAPAPEAETARAQSNFVNVDRLEKKKNREKRRRNEVNERFDELVEVMDNAQSQLMNNTGYSNEYSKSILTKSDLLEKAVELVKALAEENKKLRTMQQPPPQAMQMGAPPGFGCRTPAGPGGYPNWSMPQNMPPFNPGMYGQMPAGGGIRTSEFQPFMQQPQQMPLQQGPQQQGQQQPVQQGQGQQGQGQQGQGQGQQKMQPLPNLPLSVGPASVLSYSDMAQLGNWGQATQQQQQQFNQYHQDQYPDYHQHMKTEMHGDARQNQTQQQQQQASAKLLATHPECA